MSLTFSSSALFLRYSRSMRSLKPLKSTAACSESRLALPGLRCSQPVYYQLFDPDYLHGVRPDLHGANPLSPRGIRADDVDCDGQLLVQPHHPLPLEAQPAQQSLSRFAVGRGDVDVSCRELACGVSLDRLPADEEEETAPSGQLVRQKSEEEHLLLELVRLPSELREESSGGTSPGLFARQGRRFSFLGRLPHFIR